MYVIYVTNLYACLNGQKWHMLNEYEINTIKWQQSTSLTVSLSAPCHSWEWAEQYFCGGEDTFHTDSKNHTCGWKRHSVQVRITLNYTSTCYIN